MSGKEFLSISSLIHRKSTECPVCFITYNDSVNIPRLMPCGNEVCSICLDFILNSSLSCPICREQLKGKTLESFPVSRFLQDFIVNNREQICGDSYRVPPKLTKNYFGWCKLHSGSYQFRCVFHKMWLCSACIESEHSKCTVISVNQFMSKVKPRFFKTLNEKFDEYKRNILKCNEEMDKNRKSVSNLNAKASEIRARLKNTVFSVRTRNSKAINIMKENKQRKIRRSTRLIVKRLENERLVTLAISKRIELSNLKPIQDKIIKLQRNMMSISNQVKETMLNTNRITRVRSDFEGNKLSDNLDEFFREINADCYILRISFRDGELQTINRFFKSLRICLGNISRSNDSYKIIEVKKELIDFMSKISSMYVKIKNNNNDISEDKRYENQLFYCQHLSFIIKILKNLKQIKRDLVSDAPNNLVINKYNKRKINTLLKIDGLISKSEKISSCLSKIISYGPI